MEADKWALYVNEVPEQRTQLSEELLNLGDPDEKQTFATNIEDLSVSRPKYNVERNKRI